MQIDPEAMDILKDVTFENDIKGPAVFVLWRKVPMGMIRPVDKIPSVGRGVPAQERQVLRDEYKKRLGMWYDPFTGKAYFPTKEEAAREQVIRVLRTAGESPFIQAALREDSVEIERLTRQVRANIGLAAE